MFTQAPEPLNRQIERAVLERRERKTLRIFAPVAFGASLGIVGLLVATALGFSHRWTVSVLCLCAGTLGPALIARFVSSNPEWGGTVHEDDVD